MKLFILFLFIVHGLIHLLGFVKGFGFTEVKQLTQEISKPAGATWLITSILFLLAALLSALKINHWWWIAYLAILISQILIFTSWQDAKFGTIANVILLVFTIIGMYTFQYHAQYKNDVKNNLRESAISKIDLLSENDLTPLPEPIKKYLRYTGCVGKPKVHNFKIKFAGKIRKNENEAWMEFNSEQYNFMENSTRLFFMKAVMKGLPVAGYHCYLNGLAFMDIRLLSIFKVQFQDGAEMNVAETVTFFNDMCCLAPATLIDSRIQWEQVNEKQVDAAFTNNGITIHAHLFFNENGELINFKSNDRYNYDAGARLPWSTPLKNYKLINGYKLAHYADAVYTYDRGDVCYGTFEMTDAEYNCTDFSK